jgi:D-cysteine desulfhydrase family pyridoxal phosphate-dependent enzyme
VKRDDATGLAMGGNKARKLEFLVGEALARGATTLITAGGIQSNHVRQTAAAAAKHGLECRAILVDRVSGRGPSYLASGNILLDDLLGAKTSTVPGGTDADAALSASAEEVTAAGGVPYVIPIGGSNATGALGYVDCAREIVAQAATQGEEVRHIVLASGSAGTQAGLVAGLAAMRSGIVVHGISIDRSEAVLGARVAEIVRATLARLGSVDSESALSVRVYDRFIGDGYGQPTRAMWQALRMAAETEGLILDPVYTGKAMAGFSELVREGAIDRNETVVFLHTGGAPGLFGYAEAPRPS